jgi:hypothetical protein
VDNFDHYGLRSQLVALIGADAALWGEGYGGSLDGVDTAGRGGDGGGEDRKSQHRTRGTWVTGEVEGGNRGEGEGGNRGEGEGGNRGEGEGGNRGEGEGGNRGEGEGGNRGEGGDGIEDTIRDQATDSDIKSGRDNNSSASRPFGWGQDLDQYGQVRTEEKRREEKRRKNDERTRDKKRSEKKGRVRMR